MCVWGGGRGEGGEGAAVHFFLFCILPGRVVLVVMLVAVFVSFVAVLVVATVAVVVVGLCRIGRQPSTPLR